MPVNKSAWLRYRIIDGCLTNPRHVYPSMEFIIDKIEEQNGSRISNSMFTKDLENMRIESGAPIKFDRYHKGYHYTEQGFSLKEFPLTHAEIEALDFSTALLQQVKGTRMFQQFESAINKMTEGYRISKILGKSEKQILQVEEPINTEGNRWLEKLLKAIVEKECLQVTYQAYGGTVKEHEYSGYLLKEYRNRWYAVGYSKKAKSVLVLALDRILAVNACNGKYMSDETFIPDDFFKYSLGITQIHEEAPSIVVLQFTPEQAPYILSQPLHSSQQIVSDDEKGLRIQLEVYQSHELLQTILGFGDQVKVLKPAGLKKEIIHILRSGLKQYTKAG